MPATAEDKPKVLLIGIDAADPDYLARRFAAGHLPHLASFRENGAWGRMRSTFPVLSSAAWSTISTGLPPEKHGIYEFFRRKPGTWQDEPVHGGMKKGKDFWRIAADQGLRTVTVNMPMTYPPAKVPQGVVVSGMDTPGESADFVAPAEEKPRLFREVPDYRIELTAAQFDTIDHFLEMSSRMMTARKRAALYLFDRHRPDLAVVVFTALDRVLHALWKYVDPAHPAYSLPEAESHRARVDRLYDEVDSHVGELLEWAGPGATVLLCSDHGGSAVHGVFYLNRWLIRQGYLAVRGGGKAFRAGARAQKWVKKNVPRAIKNYANRIVPGLHADMETLHGLGRIIPEETRLYAWRKTDVLRANLAGREPGGIVQQGPEFEELLREAGGRLEAVVDDRNGNRPIRKVRTRKEVYPLAGPLDDCPDLVIEWADRLYAVDTTLDDPGGPLFVSEEKPDRPWREEINGDHALHGIFAARGAEVERGTELGTVDITCVAPSVLAALGLEKPGEMTGEPVAGLSPGGRQKLIQAGRSDAARQDRESRPEEKETGRTADDGSRDRGADVYSEEEKKIIEKRLRDLGYM